jgi:hypothetical protein
MKKIFLFYLAMALQLNCFAQATTSFVRLPVTLGYIIDSTENKEKALITFMPEKQFRVGALLQLADSSIVFRIATTGYPSVRNINYSKAMAVEFIRDLNNKVVKGDFTSDIPDSNFYALLADSGTVVRFITLEDLIEKQAITRQMQEISKSTSEQNQERVFFAAATGLGIGQVAKGTGGLSTGIKLTYLYKHLTAGMRYCGARNISLFGNDDEFSHDFSILAGIHYIDYNFYASVMSGVSFITHQYYGKMISTYFFGSNYELLVSHEVGIPIDAQIDFLPHNAVGIGIHFFTAISKIQYYGGMLTLRVGRLTPKKKHDH